MSFRAAIRSALDEELARDKNVLLLGEDVGVAGGVFKVTERPAQEIRRLSNHRHSHIRKLDGWGSAGIGDWRLQTSSRNNVLRFSSNGDGSNCQRIAKARYVTGESTACHW